MAENIGDFLDNVSEQRTLLEAEKQFCRVMIMIPVRPLVLRSREGP